MRPPRLSTMTCWPSRSPSFGAINRAVRSWLPPVTVVTIRTAFTGNCCAIAGTAIPRQKAEVRRQTCFFALPITHYPLRPLPEGGLRLERIGRVGARGLLELHVDHGSRHFDGGGKPA